MQAEFIVSLSELAELFEWFEVNGGPDFYLYYSDYGEEMRTFASYDEWLAFARADSGHYWLNSDLALHFPQAKGYVDINRVSLDPRRCRGHSFRYQTRGWGIIHLGCSAVRGTREIHCRLPCNTRKGAESWFNVCPEMKDPDLWDWKVVESIARRLRRFVHRYERR